MNDKNAIDDIVKVLKKRWGNIPDIEKYFKEKSESFLKNLKKDVDKKMKKENMIKLKSVLKEGNNKEISFEELPPDIQKCIMKISTKNDIEEVESDRNSYTVYLKFFTITYNTIKMLQRVNFLSMSNEFITFEKK